MNFFQSMHPKNMKQIITNRDLPVRLKNVFIKSFGDVFAIISILILEYELYKKDKEFETPAEIHTFYADLLSASVYFS